MFTLDKFTLSDIDDDEVVNVLREIGFTGDKLQDSFTLTPLTSQSSANNTDVPAAPDTRICQCKRGNTSATSKLSIDGIEYLIGQTTMPGFPLTSEQKEEVKNAVTSISHSHRLSDQAYVAFPVSYCQDVLEEIRDIREQRLCKICMDNETCATFVPCGHLVSCMECYNKVQCCPVCKASIDSVIKTYIA
ncbi:baculoviral IAP repeat-containing protein 7 [Biomphalaria glabrata]|nr:baculoviral IAP repeat-containing protein 7-like [Biomphalaria glabrata]KAI8750564.1 baculoviral IAP repeat-containing protein 7 [Biomphalaria glabrata]